MTSPKQAPLRTDFPPKPEPAMVMGEISLAGKIDIVTGGYSGIGLETTRALARAGAHVIVPGRSPDKAQLALSSVEESVVTATLDLGDLASVRAFASAFADQHKTLHILINNAGIMACPETRMGPGWEAQFATNHLGHFALAQALTPQLQAAQGARVVCLSSVAHRRADVQWDDIQFERQAYDKWLAYAQSKSANALHAVGLDQRLKNDGVRAFAVHPGGILTPLQRHLPKEEMIVLGWIDTDGEIAEAAKPFFKTPAQGAATSLWCAVSPALDGMGGVYCEDCNIAEEAGPDSPPYGQVAPWAIDVAGADRLWSVSETLIGTG
ncbi:MAG: oxidoreductase [Pseudomonadota bacterium]